MFSCIVSSLITSLQMYSVIDKVGFAKIIFLRPLVCYLVRLKYCYSKPSKNDCILK